MEVARKQIDWASMTANERFNVILEKVIKASEGGVFNASKNESIDFQMKKYGIREKIFKNAGVILSYESRNKLAIMFLDMTQDERMRYSVEYIKKHAIDGSFRANGNDAFYENAKKYGVYDTAKKEALKIRTYSDIIEEIETGIRVYKKKQIRECNTINELIATVLPKVKKEILDDKIIGPALIQFLIEISQNGDIVLSLFDREAAKDLIGKVKMTNQNKIRCQGAINRIFLKKGIESGIYIPEALGFNCGEMVKYYIGALKKKIKAPKTVFEHCVCHIDWSNLKGIDNSSAYYFLHKHAKVLPCEFKLNALLEYKTPGRETKDSQAGWVGEMKSNFLSPLQKLGVLPEMFFKKGLFFEWYAQHLKDKDKMSLSERTVRWYVMEAYSDNIDDSRIRYAVAAKFKDVIDVKVKNFSSDHLKKLRSAAGIGYSAVINKMIEDEVCSCLIFEQNHEIQKKEKTKKENWQNYEEQDEFDWDSNVWYYGKRKRANRSKYDFNLIPEVFMGPAKVFVWEDTNRLNERLMGGIKYLAFIFKEFLKIGVDSLFKLTEDKKKKFYLILKNMERKGDTQRAKAIRILVLFRRFIQTLRKLNYKGLSETLTTKNDGFSLKKNKSKISIYSEDDMQKILDFIKNHNDTKSPLISRLEVCALGLVALTARRIGEIVESGAKTSTGLKVDAIGTWGMSKEYGLTYYSPKHKAWEYVLLEDLAHNRTDLFGQELVSLVVSLFKEAVEITSKYRHALPVELKDLLFVVAQKGGGYRVLNDALLRRKAYDVFRLIDIDRGDKGIHEFRHTMATNIILSGGTIADAADALNDASNTVARHYQEYVSRIDTMKHFAEKGRVQMVDPVSDSAHFDELSKKKHMVLMPNQMSEGGHKVVGGSCIKGLVLMLSCPSYQIVNSPDGCVGCRHLEVNAIDDKEYWIALMKSKLEEMEKAPAGSTSYRWEKAGYARAMEIVEDLEQRELEHEFN